MAARAGLVTGGSSGIGKALARALAQEGHAVTIAARDEGKLAKAADELRAEGVEVEAVPTDLADEQAIEALVHAHERAHGRMDVLVNSAADGTAGLRIADLPTDVLDRNLDVNLRALFLTLRASLPMLRQAGAEHGKALVVNVSSMSAWAQSAGVGLEEMVQPSDLGEALRFLLRTSTTCLVREIELVPRAQDDIIRRLVAHRAASNRSRSD
jgi:NAD(P)-dependent dehydrogenase (short-subunit alcohol dehydrogenase family)